MKKLLYFLVITSIISCKILESKKKQIVKNGFLSYSLSTESNKIDVKDSFLEMFKDAKNKEDSLLIENFIKVSTKLASSLKTNQEKHDYYIINDTIKIKAPKEKTIYLPKTFKKFTEKKIRDKTYKSEVNWGALYKRWNTNYTVEFNRKDKKQILGIDCYKLILTENSVRSFDTYIEVYELYVNDEYNIPFTYYDFLKLKNQLNFNGLILECKTYYKETPGLNNIYRLTDYNFKKQQKSLIEFNKSEYIKQNL